VKPEPNKTAIFSGRFSPPHLGHLHTILNIAKIYGRVLVVILDYPDREVCSADEARDIFNGIFDAMFPETTRSTIQVIINDIHFATIGFAQYDTLLRNNGLCLNHSIYLSGNQEVLENMKREGIKHRYFPRTDDYLYTGTKIREQIKEGRNLDEFVSGSELDPK
jgi:nicotinamide mononucleotide adenylyltransferase